MKIAVLGLRSIGGECSGGIERHVQELSTRMVALGHEVTVFCRKQYNNVGTEFKGVRLVNRPAMYSKHLEAITHTGLAVPSTLVGYDVVHFHATGPSLLSWVPRLAGVSTVVTVHGLDFLRAKWGRFASMVLRAGAWTSANSPSSTIVVSQALQSYYKQEFNCDAFYIPNGIDSPELMPLKMLARFGVDPGRYILSLGRLVPEKGIHYLLEAFRQIDTDLKLLIVGGGSHSDGYFDKLKTIAGNDSRIVFTGPLYGEEKAEAYSNAKMFVIPSDLEGMPIAMLEAMSYGCPTLSSDIPECKEVVGGLDEGLCLSFESGNVVDLKRTIEVMIRMDNLNEIGMSGREHVISSYNWDMIVDQTLDVYRSACGFL
ncbi:glycosyltransferase family 4 protein [Desulfovibrio mangrovi]|uniref:glycosyltransferase family 4 protein n=1 Tax=Desulfovibrio mangrovi TaxID=2976983 RepID=UPI00224802B2|nr:glycosyltransferase family 4 protein [Desulfovibrio mangrovi]UZP67619.1 glycosyltransferase family 4 protein [Desulfovibrio mangrovi]